MSLQYDHGERLDEVVVSAEVECFGLVVLAVLRGQHHDRHPLRSSAQLTHDLIAVETGQHDVEHYCVEFLVNGTL
ncbi:Uncharacterised protein [Mycobacteroides abscessus subsp. abscessus]|nr:Uncharacterised protein [Mycobacteroides abscessus subsp. abscessus]